MISGGIEVNYRSSHRRCSVKKVFLEILQDSQKNTCARNSFLIKLQTPGIKTETLRFCVFNELSFVSTLHVRFFHVYSGEKKRFFLINVIAYQKRNYLEVTSFVFKEEESDVCREKT